MNAKRTREQLEETDERHNANQFQPTEHRADHDDTASEERPRKKERIKSLDLREERVAMPLPVKSRSCILRSLE